MELDFSVRAASEPAKRSCSPISFTEADSDMPSTPEHVKRLRAEIDTAFEEARVVAQTPTTETCVSEDRPPTPDHLLHIRMLIDNECQETAPVAHVQPEPPREATRKEDPFKNAGLFREFGGIKGWMALQRQEKERRGVSTVSLP